MGIEQLELFRNDPGKVHKSEVFHSQLEDDGRLSSENADTGETQVNQRANGNYRRVKLGGGITSTESVTNNNNKSSRSYQSNIDQFWRKDLKMQIQTRGKQRAGINDSNK